MLLGVIPKSINWSTNGGSSCWGSLVDHWKMNFTGVGMTSWSSRTTFQWRQTSKVGRAQPHQQDLPCWAEFTDVPRHLWSVIGVSLPCSKGVTLIGLVLFVQLIQQKEESQRLTCKPSLLVYQLSTSLSERCAGCCDHSNSKDRSFLRFLCKSPVGLAEDRLKSWERSRAWLKWRVKRSEGYHFSGSDTFSLVKLNHVQVVIF